jgi:hypothetical protein
MIRIHDLDPATVASLVIFVATYSSSRPPHPASQPGPPVRGDDRRPPDGAARDRLPSATRSAAAINWETIVLLLGMMVVVAYLKWPASSTWSRRGS